MQVMIKSGTMKVYLDTIGCRLNQSEIENYARQFLAAGHELVATMQEAEMMVLNTCSVTAAAASDSRQKIRQANRAGIAQIVVTGCMSTLEPEKIEAMPGVVQVVPNESKDTLVPQLLQIEIPAYDLEPLAREPVPGSRMRTRAFIKAQDGCDNKCTFCITTLARGEGRSISVEDVIADIQAAQQGGAQEAVLTGVHLGSWGADLAVPKYLRYLIEQVLARTEIPRLRVSSLEPWDLEDDFFDLWQEPRLCRHLHLPLQSGSGAVLRRMARKTTPEKFRALIKAARSRIPDVAITTDMIVGFPGETEEEFEESRAFLAEMAFAGVHVFTYSARQGTAAAVMPRQVHNYTRKERSQIMREIAARSGQAFRGRFVGQEMDVLWESARPAEDGGWLAVGLTDNYLKVFAKAAQPVANQITRTKLLEMTKDGLLGEVLEYPDRIVF